MVEVSQSPSFLEKEPVGPIRHMPIRIAYHHMHRGNSVRLLTPSETTKSIASNSWGLSLVSTTLLPITLSFYVRPE